MHWLYLWFNVACLYWLLISNGNKRFDNDIVYTSIDMFLAHLLGLNVTIGNQIAFFAWLCARKRKSDDSNKW